MKIILNNLISFTISIGQISNRERVGLMANLFYLYQVGETEMRFLDLFAGIGGFRLGMEQAGHECVGWVECDPKCGKCKKFTKHLPSEKHNYTICSECGTQKRQHARFSYEAIHDTEGEWTANDITTVTDEEIRSLRERDIDVICGGFPCQSFSVAGKRGGFTDTRGTMFFEIARFAKEIKPRYLFLENVKGLLNHNKGNTFATILHTLDELGYDAEWQVLNSKNVGGVPQNRERTFIIGHLRGTGGREVFPIGRASQNTCEIFGKVEGINGHDILKRVYDPNGLSPTLHTMGGGSQEPKVVIEPFNTTMNGHSFAITTRTPSCYLPRHVKESKATLIKVTETEPLEQERRGHVFEEAKGCASDQGVFTENLKIRKLTPRECWRLQSYPEWAFDKAAEVNSDSQLYKQAGNSVTVSVIYEIAKRLA